MTLACAGCGNRFAEREPLARALPPPPAFAVPSAVPAPRKNEYELAVAARERNARRRDASTIVKFREWYGDVRKQYGAQ